MTSSEQDAIARQMVENYLNKIFDQVFSIMSDRDRLLVREFIEVEEYGVALGGLAEIIQRSDKPVAPELRDLFEAAAHKMDMKPGDSERSVDKLLWPNHKD